MGIYSNKLNYKSTIESCQNEYIKADRESTLKYRKKYKYTGYQPCAILITSYGCRNHCAFCIRWRIENPKQMELPMDEVIDEIVSINEPYIMICDSDFLINKKRLLEFMDLLEERNIKKTFMCYGSVNTVLENEDILDRLSKNGLKAVIVGYESFDDKYLSKWTKKTTADNNYKATEILKKAKIATWGTFIIHPDFSKEDFKKSKEYIKYLKPELMSYTPLCPHPLTPLYNEYRDRLIYEKEDYEKWSFGDVVIYPSKMSLKRYYFEILLLGIFTNLNWYSLKYGFKTFPLKNNFRMIFGFNQILKVYFKNILFGGKKCKSLSQFMQE